MLEHLENQHLPRIVILAQAGSWAGDLAACLSGHFQVERATYASAALAALSRGCRAILVTGSMPEWPDGTRRVIEHALKQDCRVLSLGAIPPAARAGFPPSLRLLPSRPTPAELLAALRDLSPGRQAGSA